MVKIATFGSLKKGFYNHTRFSLDDPIDKSSIRGAMYLLYTYPHLFREEVADKDQVRDHEVEIFEVSDELYAMLATMELNSGYQEYHTTLEGESGESHDVVIFYSQDDYDYKSNPLEEYSKETVPSAYTETNKVKI